MRNFAAPVLALALAALAHAGTVTATLNSVTPGVGLTATQAGNPTATTAGRFNWTATVNNSTFGLAVDGGGNFTAFCIELTQNVGIGGSYTYTETFLPLAPDPAGAFSPMGVAKAQQIGRLFSVYAADSIGDANLKAAALQTAIWETVYDNADGNAINGLSAFYVDNAVVGAKANLYLAAQPFAAEMPGLYALTSPTHQDMVVVPAPGAATLLGLGGLLVARRRR